MEKAEEKEEAEEEGIKRTRGQDGKGSRERGENGEVIKTGKDRQ